MLTLEDLKDKKLKELIAKYRYTQIQEDHEYEYGPRTSIEGDAINEALKAEHELVDYINNLKLD